MPPLYEKPEKQWGQCPHCKKMLSSRNPKGHMEWCAKKQQKEG